MPPCDTVNKMARRILTNENTIAPWAPRCLNEVLFSDRARESYYYGHPVITDTGLHLVPSTVLEYGSS